MMRALASAFDPERLGLLVAFLAYAIATAVFLPRLFNGRVEVFGVSGSLAGTTMVQPSAGNVTQTCLMTLSVATAVAVSVVGSRPDFRRHFLVATLLGGVALVVTGAIDSVAYNLGVSAILDPFRNVTYSLLTDTETLGAKRVVGLMSEASSYGSACVVALATLSFLRPCFTPRLRRTVVPLTIAGLLVMSALSTSSGAYIGLGIFAAAFAANWLIRLSSPHALARDELRSEFLMVAVVAFAILVAGAISPNLLAPASELVNAALFEKTTSTSFIDRGALTAMGWRAFIESGYLGVGLGSVRVSNWLVSILGSTGIVGGLLMFGFVLRSLVGLDRLVSPLDREWRRSWRFSLLPPLVMSYLIGTMPDIGVALAAIYGLLASTGPTQTRLSARSLSAVERHP